MDLFKKIGISFSGNYLVQGTYEEKCKLSKRLNIPNIEIDLNKVDTNINFKKIFSIYNKNLIFTLPLISYNLSNLKEVEQLLIKTLLYDIDTVILKAYNLDISEYEWSTEEEKRNFVKEMARGIAVLASNKIVVAIENHTYSKKDGYFGQNMNHISDLLVFSRKILVEEYNFTESNANKYIKICLNINNIIKNSSSNEFEKWIRLFRNNIACIKIEDIANYEKLLNKVLIKYLENNLECPILLSEASDLDEIPQRFSNFINNINLFSKNNNLEFNDKVSTKYTNPESGFTNLIVITMIVLTVIIAILMIYIKFNG